MEIIRFCVVGGISFAADYGLLYFCTDHLEIDYLVSAAISFTIAVAFNYWLCIKFVFKNIHEQAVKQKILFIGSSIMGLVINQICMFIMVEYIKIYYMLAKIFATAIVTIWNYLMKRRAIVS